MTSTWRYAISSARRSRGGTSDHSFTFCALRGTAPVGPDVFQNLKIVRVARARLDCTVV
jgi:hypothetical protein